MSRYYLSFCFRIFLFLFIVKPTQRPVLGPIIQHPRPERHEAQQQREGQARPQDASGAAVVVYLWLGREVRQDGEVTMFLQPISRLLFFLLEYRINPTGATPGSDEFKFISNYNLL